jgi:aryl-alcohol dehydrogenase-like predicted oxidoreductase
MEGRVEGSPGRRERSLDVTRRDILRSFVSAGAALVLGRLTVSAQQADPLLTRMIPSSGEALPVIGLGSAGTFGGTGFGGRLEPLREVLRLFYERGGRFFDTSPTYGEAEHVSGSLARELGIHEELFLATKVSTPLVSANEALAEWSMQEAAVQRSASRRAWNREVLDLNQVHNLYGVELHLPALYEAREAGRTRYVGVTVQAASQYADLERVMRTEELDFVQVNYSLSEREAADRILPLARDRNLAVVVNKPFDGGVLFSAVRGHDLPPWAADFDCASWGQFFLKYIVSHPAVTVTVPATSNPAHLVDNMGGGVGRLPDERARTRMEAFFDALPSGG